MNKLVGIPFKLNGKDFKGCDCRGICWLYYNYIKGKTYPFTDGGEIFKRDKKKDIVRILKVLKEFTIPIEFNYLQESDIIILKTNGDIGALGICINKYQVLHMDRVVGSCLTKLHYLKDLFLYGFRPND